MYSDEPKASEFTVSHTWALIPFICPRLYKETSELVDNLLERTQRMLDVTAANVVALSGGVDSSLVAALVYKTYESHPDKAGGSAQAVPGKFPNLK